MAAAVNPVGRMFGGLAEWGILMVGIAGVVGFAVSIPAALSALAAWLIAGVLTGATPWRETAGAAAVAGAAVLAAAGSGVLRYRRNVTAARYCATLLLAPVFAILAFIPMVLMAAAVLAVAGRALASGLESALGLTEFVLMGVAWGVGVSLVLALASGGREVWVRMRSKR